MHRMELSNIFPAMTSDETRELEADIKKNGLLEPIILLDGKIPDGYHRATKIFNREIPQRVLNFKKTIAISFAECCQTRLRYGKPGCFEQLMRWQIARRPLI